MAKQHRKDNQSRPQTPNVVSATQAGPVPTGDDPVGARKDVNFKDHLDIFAKTGHESLKAYLLVSAGAVAIFMAFMGAVLSAQREYIPVNDEFMTAMTHTLSWFIGAVAACMLAFAFSFGSHALYYKDQTKWGNYLSCGAIFCGFGCILGISMGGVNANTGLELAGKLISARQEKADKEKATKEQAKEDRKKQKAERQAKEKAAEPSSPPPAKVSQ